ncbi:hypothetical protein FOCC_FOCC014807 [Frankliniella occidentalis]|nr:hypothetical protein FOCC_FOCC014807 [Frankliniella occidentalis]
MKVLQVQLAEGGDKKVGCSRRHHLPEAEVISLLLIPHLLCLWFLEHFHKSAFLFGFPCYDVVLKVPPQQPFPNVASVR